MASCRHSAPAARAASSSRPPSRSGTPASSSPCPPATPATSPRVFGFTSFAGPSGIDEFTPISQSPATGAGSVSDPLQQVTRYVAEPSGSTLSVTQTTTYVNGAQQFQIRWDVQNVSGSAVTFKALAAADFYFDGSDRGTGIYTEGPPRFIGGTNADTGNSGGMIEATGSGLAPWSAYQALEWGPAPTRSGGRSTRRPRTAPTFDDTVLGEPVDNAGGVEWDQDATGPAWRPAPPAPTSWLSAAPSPRHCSSRRATAARLRACRSTSGDRARHQRPARMRAGR